MADVTAKLAEALRRAFALGQTYWQQADSESFTQNAKSEVTHQKFRDLMAETLAAYEQAQAATPAPAPEMAPAFRTSLAYDVGFLDGHLAATPAPAETFDEKCARNARVQSRYDELMREGKHGHYETMFRVVREEVERARAAQAATPAPGQDPRRWPFLESPASFARRLDIALAELPDTVAAVRHVLIENPPAKLAATPAPAPQDAKEQCSYCRHPLFAATKCHSCGYEPVQAATPAPAEPVPVRVHQLLAALTTNDDAHARARFAIELRALYGAATPAPAQGSWVSADDVDRLARDLDVAMNGEEGAAHRPALCDVVPEAVKRLAATPAPAPAGYVAAEIYAAWRKVGADVCGLKWDAFIDALRAGQGKEDSNG